jgi:hypothetical protein
MSRRPVFTPLLDCFGLVRAWLMPGSLTEAARNDPHTPNNKLRRLPTPEIYCREAASNAAPAVAGAAFMLVLLVDTCGPGCFRPETLVLMSPQLLGSSFCSLVLAELVDLLPLG